jgi:hypothetical protein
MELRIPGGKTMSQLDRIEQMLLSLQSEMSTVKSELSTMNQRMANLEETTARLEEKTDRLEEKTTRLEEKTDKLEKTTAKQEDLLRLEEVTAKQEDLLTAIDVLSEVTEEVATTAETRTDAGYVTLESLFKGLEDRLANTKLELGQYAEKGFQEIGSILHNVYQLAEQQTEALNRMKEEQTKDMNQRFSQLSDIMRSWVYKQNLLDNELKRLKEQVDKISGDFEQ